MAGRRRGGGERFALTVLLALVAGGGLLAYVRAWYHRNQAEVDGVLRWAVPLALGLLVTVAALVVRAAVRRESRTKVAIRAHNAKVREHMAAVAARDAAEVEPEQLPGPEYLYRFFGWWQDPDHPQYPDGPWHADVKLYIGRSNDFEKRNGQHEADSHWHPNVTGSTQQVFRSYVAEDGTVVTAHEQLVQAEREAIETEHPKHNIMHNGAQGQRERLLRQQIRAYQQRYGSEPVSAPPEPRRTRRPLSA